MRNPQGYAVIVSPDNGFICLDEKGRLGTMSQGVTEFDSFTCFHCGSVKHVQPRERPEDLGGLCKQCMKLICKHCLDKGCTPLEKKLEAVEQRERALRSYGVL